MGQGVAKMTLRPISFHPTVTRASASSLGKETGSNVFSGADKVERPPHHLPQLMAWRSNRAAGEKRSDKPALESGLSLNLTALWPFYFVGQ